MGRCETTLKEHAHGVTLVTHWRLNTDHDIAEGFAEHEKVLTVSPFLAGCWTPLRLNLSKPRFSSDVVVHRHALVHICLGPELLGIPVKNGVTELSMRSREINPITLIAHRRERIE